MGDITALSGSCKSMDTNVLLAIVTKWEDMGCMPGTTLEYLLLPRVHDMQKPSISQGLHPILLLALLVLMTSAYTSLGVSQDSNLWHQLLKASVYNSATSAIGAGRYNGIQRRFGWRHVEWSFTLCKVEGWVLEESQVQVAIVVSPRAGDSHKVGGEFAED